MSSITITVTLGHDGLSTSKENARALIAQALDVHAATLFSTFRDGLGSWTTDEGTTFETCDAWIASIPQSAADSLRASLVAIAHALGQDALGYIIHDHRQYGPSVAGVL